MLIEMLETVSSTNHLVINITGMFSAMLLTKILTYHLIFRLTGNTVRDNNRNGKNGNVTGISLTL